MELGHLRTFVAIVDAGGVHRAAARLHLSQPAVSRQLHSLESELGVPLFDRIGRRVQLTSEGEDLLRRSCRLLADAHSIVERASALKNGDTGILRVGATPQVLESSLANFLNHFHELYPRVEVQLIEDGGQLSRPDLSAVTLSSRSWQWTTSVSSIGYSIPHTGWLWFRLRTSSPVVVPLKLPSWPKNRSFYFVAVSQRAIGSKLLARLLISGLACCWRARRLTLQWRWLERGTE